MRLHRIWILLAIALGVAANLELHVEHARGFFSSIESLAGSLLGITPTSAVPSSTIVDSPVSTEAQPTEVPTSAPAPPPAPAPTPPPAPAPIQTTELPVVDSSLPASAPPPVPSTTEVLQPPTSSSFSTVAPSTTIIPDLTSTTSSSSSTTSSPSSSSSSTTTRSVQSITPPAGSTAVPAAPSVPTQNNGAKSNVSPAAIVVAVFFSLVTVGLIVYMIVRYHPATNAKFTAWREKRRKERELNDSLDTDEEIGIVKAQAVTLTPIIIQRGRGLGLDIDGKSKPSADDRLPPAPLPTAWTQNRYRPYRPFSFQPRGPQRPPTGRSLPREVRRKPVPSRSVAPSPRIGVAMPMPSPTTQQMRRSKGWSGIQKLRRISGLHELS